MYAMYSSGSIKWKYTTGGTVNSAPVIDSNGIVYFGSTDSNIYAIYPSGSVVWSYFTNAPISSSPAIGTNGTIYFGVSNGALYALNTDGIPLWITQTPGLFDIASPMVGPDGSLYIGSYFDDHSMYSISSSGSIRWQFVTNGQVDCTAALTPSGNIVFNLYNLPQVYSLTSSGSLNWIYTITAVSSSSPVVDYNGIIYVACDRLFALTSYGSLVWETLISLYPLQPVIASDGLLYAGSGTTVYTVGTLLSTVTPSKLPLEGLQTESAYPKFKGNNMNTVSMM
jgi:outer membrane protein assembly factor BamB